MGLTMVAAANLVEVAALVDDTARATMGNGEPVVPIFIGRGAGMSPGNDRRRVALTTRTPGRPSCHAN